MPKIAMPYAWGFLQGEVNMNADENKIEEMNHRLTRIEASLELLVREKLTRDWYTTAEIARILDRSEFTVREYCRHGRIKAHKKDSGRGSYASWVISHGELLRFQKDGLIPIQKPSP
jgi:hypothetical protein